jgi:hypothetical protein
MVELIVVYVATMYVVIVGQVWWFGILSLMSLTTSALDLAGPPSLPH